MKNGDQLRIGKGMDALAKLGLEFGELEGVVGGECPTDKELIALFRGKLSSVRSQQVLSHIVNDEEVYQCWLQCYDLLNYLDKRGFRDKCLAVYDMGIELLRYLAKSSEYPFAVLGGGLATAMAVLFAVIIWPKTDVRQQLDTVYTRWGAEIGTEWIIFPETQKPRIFIPRSSISFIPVPIEQTLVRDVLATGLFNGSKKITEYPEDAFGIQLDLIEPLRYEMIEHRLTKDQYEVLLMTGELAAISAMQCILSAEPKRISSLYDVAQSLSMDLKLIPYQEAVNLNDIFTQSTEKTFALCALTKHVMALIRG